MSDHPMTTPDTVEDDEALHCVFGNHDCGPVVMLDDSGEPWCQRCKDAEDVARVGEALKWAMDEIDVLSNKLCHRAYPQGMAMLHRNQEEAYALAVHTRSLVDRNGIQEIIARRACTSAAVVSSAAIAFGRATNGIVRRYLDGYEMREPDYTPNADERVLLEDFGEGLLVEVQEAIAAVEPSHQGGAEYRAGLLRAAEIADTIAQRAEQHADSREIGTLNHGKSCGASQCASSIRAEADALAPQPNLTTPYTPRVVDYQDGHSELVCADVTADAKPSERGHRVSPSVVDQLIETAKAWVHHPFESEEFKRADRKLKSFGGSTILKLVVREDDARATIARLTAENDALRAEVATAKREAWIAGRDAVADAGKLAAALEIFAEAGRSPPCAPGPTPMREENIVDCIAWSYKDGDRKNYRVMLTDFREAARVLAAYRASRAPAADNGGSDV